MLYRNSAKKELVDSLIKCFIEIVLALDHVAEVLCGASSYVSQTELMLFPFQYHSCHGDHPYGKVGPRVGISACACVLLVSLGGLSLYHVLITKCCDTHLV